MNNMTAPPDSLLALCAKATPGPRIHLAFERTVYTRLNDGCRGLPILTADNIYLPAHQANLDLAARLTPETMWAVHQALTYAREVILPNVHFSPGSIDPPEGPEPVDAQSEEGAMCISKIEEVLRLLDGQAAP